MANKTLAEAKENLKTDMVFETETSFLVNVFGKYAPNITFVVRKDFERNPIAYRSDPPTKEMFAGMNIAFGGETEVLFGFFWKSQKGGACFRPKPVAEAEHVLLRCGWGGAFNRTRGIGHVDGALYYRRAASNGGGVGNDYMVVPAGFFRVVRDAEIDGEVPATAPNFAERAKAIRAEFAVFDREQADKADALAKAKAEAEMASREGKTSGLDARVEAVNERRLALSLPPYRLEEARFFRVLYHTLPFLHGVSEVRYDESSPLLYTEQNLAHVEREVTKLEEKATLKVAVEKLRMGFGLMVKEAGCQLGIPDHFDSSFAQFTLAAKDVEMEKGFRCSLEGIGELEASWQAFLAEVKKKRAEAKAVADKEAKEQTLREQGYPTDFTCRHERGHGKVHRQCWVIQSDGKEREEDEKVYEGHKHVATKWNVIHPGELALMWEKGSATSPHEFTVVHMLTGTLTDAQAETICAILEGIEERWEEARGFASGAPSPDVGEGWLNLETGKSLTPGFRTSRQQRNAGQVPLVRPNLDEPIKSVPLVRPVSEGGEAALADQLAALRKHFGK